MSTSDRNRSPYNQSLRESDLSSRQSNFSSLDPPPRAYEEIMRQLEADIRKHIRIEHQLKLHIETVEDRVEELEREQEKQLPLLSRLEELVSLKNTLQTKLSQKEQETLEAKAQVEGMKEQVTKAKKEVSQAVLAKNEAVNMNKQLELSNRELNAKVRKLEQQVLSLQKAAKSNLY